MQTRIHHLPTLYGHLVGHQTGTTTLIIGIVSLLIWSNLQVNTIEEALRQYFRPERIDDNMYKCERCKVKVPATKRYTLRFPTHFLSKMIQIGKKKTLQVFNGATSCGAVRPAETVQFDGWENQQASHTE